MSKDDDLKDRLDELFSSPQPEGDNEQLVVSEPVAAQAERPLRGGAAESIFDKAFENISIGMVVTGADTQFIRVNDAFATMLGYAPDELIGQSFQAVTFGEDLDIGAQALRDLLSGKNANARIQKRYVHKDGHLIWVDLNITLILDGAGKPQHFITFVQDITAQKRTDLLLEKRVRELNCLNDIGHKMDEKPTLPDFLEWVTSRVPEAYQYPDVCVASIEYKDQVFGNPEARELESAMVGGLRVAGELVGWLRVAYTEPRDFIDAESALLGGIISRVTSYIESTYLLEQTNTALLETDELSELQNAILQSAAYAIIATTPEGIITAFNPSAERMLGYSAAELVGKQTPAVFHDPEEVVQRAKLFSNELGYAIKPGFEVFVAKARHGLENEYEWTYISKKGDRIPVRLSVTALHDSDGNISGFLVLAIDIKERKDVEKALQKQATEMTTVAEVSTATATILRADELLRSVVNLTKECFNLYHAHIYRLNEDKDTLVLAAGAGEAGKKMVSQGWHIAITSEQSLVARAARELKGVIVNDVRADPGFLANEFLPATSSELAVPMVVGNELLGVLDVQSDQLAFFSDQDIVVFRTLAQQVAVALQNANQYERAQQALAAAETLYAGSAWITSANTMEKILQALIGATPLKKLDRANVVIFDHSWQVEPPTTVTVEATWEKRGRVARTPLGTNYPLDRYAVSPLLNREQPTIVADAQTDGRLSDEMRSTLVDRGVRSLAIFPLKASGEWIGAVVGEADRDVVLDVEEIRRINSLMDQAATVAQNLRLIEQASHAQARMQDILNAVTTPMLISKVSDGRIVYANSLVAEMVRTPLDTFVGGQTPNFYAVAKDREVIIDRIQKQGGVTNYELKLKRNDGEEFWALLSARLLDYQGESAIITSLIDVTDRKLSQEVVAKQASELATVAKVGTTMASVLDPKELIQSVVDLTKESFDLYHAHIYLFDADKEALVLSAGAFQVGRMMVAEGWEIPINSKRSLVAHAARDLKGVIVNDVIADPDFLPNDLLPDTASEMAVPLVIGDQLLGVLDVQSDEKEYFSEEDVSIFTTLASQVAVALQNARQYEQTQEALTRTEQSQQLLRSIIDATPDWIFIKDNDHRYQLANKGYADSLHMHPDDFIGKNDLELGFPEELVIGDPEKGIQGFWADDRLVMESGEAQIYPNDPATIDDEVHIFHTYKTPLKDENQDVWGVLAFSRDITEREQLLAETENLYKASADLNLAETYDEILNIIRRYTIATDSHTTTLNLFDRPWSEASAPEWIYLLSQISVLRAEVFSGRYKVSDFPSALELLRPDRPTVIEDMNSPEIDENARYLYTNIFKARSTIFIPFVVGGKWIGYCNALYESVCKFDDADLRRFTAIAGQAAVAVQNIFSIEQIQARARRERVLREITTNVRGSVDPDAILRTAVRELGDALGRKAFVRLGSADELKQSPGSRLEGFKVMLII